jgi:ABC-type Co2+ transport system permease subunit
MQRLVVGIVLLLALTAGWCWLLSRNYMHYKEDFVSPETRALIAQTLQVTEEQRAELNRAIRICDEIAFGLMGLAVGAVIGGCCGRTNSRASSMKAILVGLVLGCLTGALAGYMGHAYQARVVMEMNSTVHSVLRLIAMFLPFAIAVGFAAALSGNLKRDGMDTIVGAVLGLLVAATVYGLASDFNPNTRETESDIMPFHLVNRAMLMGLLSILISLMIAAQTLRKPKVPATH